jgi:nucleotide-binding universal stress UspA family protein
MDSFIADDAKASLTPLRRALERTNIAFKCHVRVGDKAPEIVKFAKEFYCPQIIIGPTPKNWMLDLLFGTLNGRVESLIRLADGRCEVL